MFIQGDLQAVFDALYTIGAIDPVLHSDWQAINNEMSKDPRKVVQVCELINQCSGDRNKLVQKLLDLDKKSVEFIALEVAREFCEFQDRKELH